MTYREFAASARTGAGGCVVLLGFAISISTAFDSILVGTVLLAWLLAAPVYLRDISRACAQFKSVLIALILFGVILASSAYSPVSWKAASANALKYLELALIPVFIWAAATPRIRRSALYAFLAGIVLNLLVSYGSALHFWDSLPGLNTFPSYPTGFRMSVTHSLLVSVAAFALLLVAREHRARSPVIALFALGLAVACIVNVLFVVIGRTGYVVLGALLAYFAATVTRGRRDVLLAGLVLTALFGSAYLGSNSFSTRVQDMASDLAGWQPGAPDETSVGLRLGYYRSTLQIIADHPLTGTGAGGFAPAYEDKISGTRAPATNNPHNDYLMIAAQAGLPAAALVLAFYVLLWRDAATLRSRLERDLLRGLVIVLGIGGLLNSLLMDHVEGLLLAWAAGMLLAGRTNEHAHRA